MGIIRNRNWIIFAVCLSLISCKMKGDATVKNNHKVLRYGMKTTGWGSLFPPQHSSLFASIIMSHVYESLVGVDSTGGYGPSLAKAWDINKNHTLYTFMIDSEKKFSDGTPLTAKICKEAFLNALKIERKEKSKKALDLLYALKGFSKFDATGNIEGLIVKDDHTLQMQFEKSFRRAIELLSGIRYAIYLKREQKYIGTGPYIYSSITNNEIELILNPYYPSKPPIERVRITGDGLKEFNEGKADVVFSYPEDETEIDHTDHHIKTRKLSSLIHSHRTIIVNGMSESIFADKNLRKAIQYIIRDDVMKNNAKDVDSNFTPNAQFYTPLSPGYLDEKETEKIIVDGKKYIDELKIKSQNKPIRCFMRKDLHYNFCDVLEKIGIRTQKKFIDYSDMKKILFETHAADLVAGRVSYASGDPDGLYDIFGKNSILRSPLFSRPAIEDLLESGRTLIDPFLIDQHYKKISRVILEEVPVIHLGNEYIYLEYNANVVEPRERISAKRDYLNAMLFQWK